MLNWIGKLIFFLSSYSPMMIILAILFYNTISLYLIAVFFIITGLLFLSIGYMQKIKSPENIYIVKKNNVNNSILEYMITYIFPFFIEFNDISIQKFIALILFFIILFIVYKSTDLIYINPILNIFGYNIFEIEYSSKYLDKEIIKTGYLITKYESSMINMKAQKVVQIHNNIFIL